MPVTGSWPSPRDLREYPEQRNPFHAIDHDVAARHIEALPGTDPESWAGHWPAGAKEFKTRAREAEEKHDPQNAPADLYLALKHGSQDSPNVP
ncbi:hypothetical protein AB0D83_10955 [Streptomyces decoyicus]|uniref:hypothetical protein n=1 Tax=Streptomyces decoyicus TaxID=249567 RepID=UPI0033EC28C1